MKYDDCNKWNIRTGADVRASGNNFFEEILNEKALTEEIIMKYKPQIEEMIKEKKKSAAYSSINISNIDWNFPCIKKIIYEALK